MYRAWESTGQEAFRVVMAQNTADQMYITGGRAWDLGYGTQVHCFPRMILMPTRKILAAMTTVET